MTEAQASLNNGFAKWERELDQWLTRVTREDAHLHVTWTNHSALGPWVVYDLANDEVVLSAPSLARACAWMLRYQQENPRTTVDGEALLAAKDHVLHSRKVDGTLTEGGEAAALSKGALLQVGEPPPSVSAPVLRLVGSGQDKDGGSYAAAAPAVRLPGADELFPELLNPRRSRA